jgi:predicted phosphoadenosine phosphosulfate sulfurtransferase
MWTVSAPVRYLADDVLTAARKRIALVFDRFERVVVSVSSGKDSTVLLHLATQEAARRGRKVVAFFLDQEAEWAASEAWIADVMTRPDVEPAWFQVPLRMTNATSHTDYFLDAWAPGAETIHPRHPLAIAEAPGAPTRFYDFFEWYERQQSGPTAFLVGLRSKESLTRFRAVTKNPGMPDVPWSTKTALPTSFRFYPLYDWTFGDVWKHIADERLSYNRLYDWMFAKYGANASTMRVSNLVHERSFRALADVQEFEPETYDRLVKRLGGVHCAALYAREDYVLNAGALPAAFATWRAFRDHILATTPTDRVARFIKRFGKQGHDEVTCQQHVKQLLINDWENNVPIRRGLRGRTREVWWGRL